MFNPLFQGKIDKSTKSLDDKEKFIISGHMSVPVIDLEGEIIGKEAYSDAIETVKSRQSMGQPVPIFIEHRRKELSLPVGKILDAGADDKGLWFKGEIANGAIGEPIRDLIKGGYLYGCSIGGDALKTVPTYDQSSKKHVNKITKMAFRELSLTGLPVNQEAVFSIAKSMNKDRKEVTLLMDTLDKAIDMQTTITALEKAVEPETLDEAGLTRIKGALNDLASLLKIDLSGMTDGMETSELGGIEQSPEMPQQEAQVEGDEVIADTPPAEVAVDEAPIAPESQVAPVAPVAPVEADGIVPEEDKAMMNVTEDAGTDFKIDEINQKLDKLLSNESIEADTGQEEIEYANADENIDSGDGDIDEYEGEEVEDDNVEINVDADNDNGEEENEFKKKKKNKKEEGENMEYLKCAKCGATYDITKSYNAKYCPECGTGLEKAQKKTVRLSADLIKSIQEVVKDAVDKSLGSVAVAPEAKGANTQYTNASKMGRGGEPSESIAIAPNPAGADTKYSGPEEGSTEGKNWKRPDAGEDNLSKNQNEGTLNKNLEQEHPPVDSGNNIDSFGDGEFIEGDKKDVTDRTGSDIQEARPSGTKILPGDPNQAEKVAQYGKDRLGKSLDLDTRLGKIEKSIEKVLDKSEGRKSVMPTDDMLIEKSQSTPADQGTLDKSFAGFLLGGNNA